jgi:hypothetical protein
VIPFWELPVTTLLLIVPRMLRPAVPSATVPNKFSAIQAPLNGSRC